MARCRFSMLAVLVSSGLSLTAHSFECSTGVVAQTKARAFAGDGSPAAIVFHQDWLVLRACAPRDDGVESLERALEERYDPHSCTVAAGSRNCVREDGRAVQLPPAIEVFCDDAVSCRAEYLERRARTSPPREERERSRDFAKMGGLPFAFLLGHAGAEGHFEITRKALSMSRAPSGAAASRRLAEIMTDASQDPDFYDWGTPGAHAQARMHEKTGVLRDDHASARQNTFAWIGQRMSEFEKQCAAGEPRLAAYLLGYALHAVQDFVFHEGMSNAEHSYRDLVDLEPVDSGHRYAEKMDLAVFATAEFLERIGRTNGHDRCLEQVYAWSGEGKLYPAEKRRLLGKKGMDLSIKALREFRDLGKRVRDTHFCPSCGDKRDEIVLRPKWLGWHRPKNESTPALLKPRMSRHLEQLFARGSRQ
jgi:hypothetical protein